MMRSGGGVLRQQTMTHHTADATHSTRPLNYELLLVGRNTGSYNDERRHNTADAAPSTRPLRYELLLVGRNTGMVHQWGQDNDNAHSSAMKTGDGARVENR
jgi:hypothetical protein